MPLDATVNFAKSTLSAGYAAGVTSITLIAGGGARFPAVPFNAVWWNASSFSDPSDDPNVEIVRVTNIVGDVLTIVRGQEGTADSNHNTPGIIYKLIEGITSSQMTIISGAFASTAANLVWAGPASGAAAAPSFRALAAADIPAASPVGAVQFNAGGALAGSADFTWGSSGLTVTLAAAVGPQAVVGGTGGITPFNPCTSILDVETNTAAVSGQNAALVVGLNMLLPSSGTSGTFAGLMVEGQTDPASTNGYFSDLFGGAFGFDHYGSGSIFVGASIAGFSYNDNAGNVDNLYCGYFNSVNLSSGTVTNNAGLSILTENDGTGLVKNMFGVWVVTGGTNGPVTNNFAYYATAQAGVATNNFPLWSDEQGVFVLHAMNTFDSVYQSRPALYNPLFAKFTPAAANFERIVMQWQTNVAVIGTEAGGTGVLRDLSLIGARVTTAAPVVLAGNVTLPFSMAKNTQAPTAPGSGFAVLRWEVGTTGGTAKLVGYAGTSATGVTIVDNVGAAF